MSALSFFDSDNFFKLSKTVVKEIGLLEAVILSDFVSTMRTTKQKWIYRQYDIMTISFKTSEHLIRKAINNLVSMNIVFKKKAGNPCMTYYSINEDQLIAKFMQKSSFSSKSRSELDLNHVKNYSSESREGLKPNDVKDYYKVKGELKERRINKKELITPIVPYEGSVCDDEFQYPIQEEQFFPLEEDLVYSKEQGTGIGTKLGLNQIKRPLKKPTPEAIERVYKSYPTKCLVTGRPLGKSSKDKKKIEKLLKEHYPIAKAIQFYVRSSYFSCTYMKNFQTLLNNPPDLEDAQVKYKRLDKFIEWCKNVEPRSTGKNQKESVISEWRKEREAKRNG